MVGDMARVILYRLRKDKARLSGPDVAENVTLKAITGCRSWP